MPDSVLRDSGLANKKGGWDLWWVRWAPCLGEPEVGQGGCTCRCLRSVSNRGTGAKQRRGFVRVLRESRTSPQDSDSHPLCWALEEGMPPLVKNWKGRPMPSWRESAPPQHGVCPLGLSSGTQTCSAEGVRNSWAPGAIREVQTRQYLEVKIVTWGRGGEKEHVT